MMWSAVGERPNVAQTQKFLVGRHERQIEDLRGRSKKTIGWIGMKIELLCRKYDFMSERCLVESRGRLPQPGQKVRT